MSRAKIHSTSRAVGLPQELSRRENQVLRPRDATDVYAQPSVELARLARIGVAQKLSNGYFALAPKVRMGDHSWHPDLNAAALGIAQADYGLKDVALIGISAARYHGTVPRAVGVAAAAIPKQRPTLDTMAGKIIFSKRVVSRLDIELATTELTTGWVTTVEQTAIDLAAFPDYTGLSYDVTVEALSALAYRSDHDLLTELTAAQHRPGALRRIKDIWGKRA